MVDLLPLLRTLISIPAVSGAETELRGILETAWQPFVDELRVSQLGNLYARKRGRGPEPRRRLLIAAHQDAIGFMVAGIQEGFLRINGIGAVDVRVLPGQPVTIHGRQDLPGIIVQPPKALIPARSSDSTLPIDQLWVDTGLRPPEVGQWVKIGDLVSFAQPCLELGKDLFAAPRLDNRASLAALTICLQLLANRPPAFDVWLAGTVQEETTMAGASTTAFELRPDLAIAVDVTYGKSPSANDYNTFGLGTGPILGYGPNIHTGVFRTFQSLAGKLGMPVQVEVMPKHSETDAYAIQTAAEGVPTMLVEIPLRNMHTPVEVVSLQDITRTGQLLAEFAIGLDEAFISRLGWD
jgi:endoglucanase